MPTYRSRGSAALLLASFILSGCGSAPRDATTAAIVNGSRISFADVRANVQYASHFYALAYPDIATSTSHCDVARTSTCLALRRQVLARLAQESIVRAYARAHGILLTRQDERQVTTALRSLTLSGADTADLFRPGSATRKRLRAIVETQVLVQKVETAVAGASALAGPSYHLDKMLVPFGHRAFHKASDLAVDGKPIPDGTVSRIEWVAPFRLHGTIAGLVEAARPGDYVGPVKQHDGYLVVRVLGTGWHPYGRPAREQLILARFRAWLASQMSHVRARCFVPPHRASTCPVDLMKKP